MKCIKCNQETPDTDTYCAHCGFKMDITYDEITKKLNKDIKQEKQEETEAFARWVLVIGIVVFFTAIFFRALWTNPPYPDPIPGYISLDELPAKTVDVVKPHYIKKKDFKK